MPITAQHKIAWESLSPSWEQENNIYGGISFFDNTVDPSLASQRRNVLPTGVGGTAGFNIERRRPSPTNSRPSGALASTRAKLDAFPRRCRKA